MIFNACGYFSYVRRLLGFRAAIVFSAYYLAYKIGIMRPTLYRMPVGQYDFYCKSIKQFAGLFMEIFLREYYYLEKTDLPLHAIDCGANIGVSLLYIKLRTPNARVVCFEPNPDAREVLEKNISANGWGHDVTVHPYALTKTEGNAEFYVDRDAEKNSGASLSKYLEQKSPLVALNIRTARLSDFIDSAIDFLKIDIEGAEFDVLEELSGENKLAHITRIQLEYHYHPDYFPRPLSELLTILESAGFRTAVQATRPPHLIVDKNSPHAYMVYAWR